VLAHGEYQLERHGQIIILSCIGAWNDYTARKMCEEFLTHAKNISDQPWACLTDLSKWELGAPEIWPPLQKLYKWSNDHNQELQAIVTVTRLQKILMKRAHAPLTKMRVQQFPERTPALHWFTENGFDLSKLLYEQNSIRWQKNE
jgi:hypothetical protein